MCSRFQLKSPVGELMETFRLTKERLNIGPRYNIAPSQSVPIVREIKGDRQLLNMRWGLIPSWAKDVKIAYSTINARADTLAEKPAFRDAYKKRRCIVPATGFYEFAEVEAPTDRDELLEFKLKYGTNKNFKQPYMFSRKDGGVMGFAGLWEHWGKDQDAITSFTIVTCEPNPLTAEIHDRMPVILDPADYAKWLDNDNTPADVAELLKPFPHEGMQVQKVSRRLNSTHKKSYVDDASLLAVD